MQPENAAGPDERPVEHVPQWETNPPSGFTLTRRTLLIGGGALLAGGLLTGLSLQSQQLGYRGLAATGNAMTLENFTHFSALVTGFGTDELDGPTAQALFAAFQQTPPVGVGTAAEVAAAASGASGSAGAATGVEETASATGEMTETVSMSATAQVTGAVTTAAGASMSVGTATMEDLLRQAGYLSNDPPQTLDDIERRGVFDEEPYASLANGVIEAWYSGLVQGADGTTTTAAWLPALGWKALAYTAAPGYCGGATGFWSDAPVGAPDAGAVTA